MDRKNAWATLRAAEAWRASVNAAGRVQSMLPMPRPDDPPIYASLLTIHKWFR